jgi:hypothetical protein
MMPSFMAKEMYGWGFAYAVVCVVAHSGHRSKTTHQLYMMLHLRATLLLQMSCISYNLEEDWRWMEKEDAMIRQD